MEDRSHEVLAVAVLFLTLTWITVLLRVYVRAGMLKSWGLDDWMMLVTQIIFTLYISCQLGGYVHGTGRHMKDLDPKQASIALHYWFFCEIFYVLASCWLKLAIGFFLLRIAIRKTHVWIIRLLMIGTGIFGAAYFFIIVLQCRPTSGFWQWPITDPNTCINPDIVTNTTYAASALNAMVDWTFGILPAFIVWDLNMNKKTKFIVAGILAFAAVGSTATIVRIPTVYSLSDKKDFLWTTTDIAIWSTVEPGIGITAGCIATLRPLFQNFLFRVGLSTLPSTSLRRQQYGRSGAGYNRTHSLNDLQSGVHPGGRTTTTIMGRMEEEELKRIDGSRRDRNGSQDYIVALPGEGIQKNFEVSVSVEHEDERSSKSFGERPGSPRYIHHK